MLAPGGAQNVFLHWLVEAGVLGFIALILVLSAMHIRIASGLNERGAGRTLVRLSFAVGLLLLLHGVSDSSLDLPGVAWLYALLLGIACGVASRPKKVRSAIR
jgi:O-antigen ligase